MDDVLVPDIQINLFYLFIRVIQFSDHIIQSVVTHSNNNEEERYSNGSLVSSEEGYYSTDSDDNKTMKKNNIKTKTYYEHEILPTSHHDHDITDRDHHHQKKHFNNRNASLHSSSGRRRHTTAVTPSTPKRTPTVRRRLKREKMNELKEVYKQYAESSSNPSDSYKILLDRYVDFNFYPDAENREFHENDTINVSTGTNKRYSVPEKEALMRCDLVLTEMADTERNYVDDLAFVINVNDLCLF